MKLESRFRTAELALARRSQKIAEFQQQFVSPRRLAGTITDYIEWRAFAYWFRLVVETDGCICDAMKALLEARCPGFLECATARQNERQPLWLKLISWIDEQIFGFAKREGWAHALGYYAARDPRSDQIENYWLRCSNEWKHNRPSVLPTLDEWRRAASDVALQG